MVIEGTLAGEGATISIEVTAGRRRAGTPWVNQMIQKHARMPTSRLVLVSWSGFSAPARAKVAAQGGWVIALTPEVVPDASVPDLNYLEVNTTPAAATLLVRNNDGTPAMVSDVPILTNLYAGSGRKSLAFTLRDLVLRVLNEQRSGRDLLDQAQAHEDRDSLTHFSVEMADLDHFGMYVSDGEGYRLLSAFVVVGPVSVSQQPVEFTVMRLRDDLFAISELVMAGKSSVWVLTPNDDGSSSVSWRLL
jgi:hypothetical protein